MLPPGVFGADGETVVQVAARHLLSARYQFANRPVQVRNELDEILKVLA